MTIELRLGKGAQDASGNTWYAFGQPFGSTPPSGFGSNSGAMTILGETTTFDVSSISESHEVAFAFVNIHEVQGEDKTISTTLTWYRQEGNNWVQIFQYIAPNQRYVCIGTYCNTWVVYSYIGWTPATRDYPGEIIKNGTNIYKVVATVTGDVSYTSTIYFSITGMPQGSGTPGYIWIEYNNICFIDERGYKRTVNVYDTPSGSGTPGYLWIDGNYINYVGWAGNIKRADAIPVVTNYKPQGTNIGYLWVENNWLFYTGTPNYNNIFACRNIS